jgi:simple sugar transport system permease protein
MIELFLAASFSTATPLILTTIGGAFAEKSRTTNISMEGLMLISAFFAVVFSSLFNNAWIGLLGGVIMAVMAVCLFSFMVFKLGCNLFIGGIGFNLFASGLTLLLMNVWFNEPGAYAPRNMPILPKIDIGLLSGIPIIGPAVNNQSILFFIAVVSVFLAWLVMEKTKYGYWVRAVGENEDAASAVGIHSTKIRISTLLISGFMAGLGGAFLSISSLGVYAHNMTASRGFIAFAATIFGGGKIISSVFAAFVFGMAEAASIRLQRGDMPTQIVMMLPFVATILALTVFGLRKKLKGEEENLESYVPSIIPKE